MLSSNTALHEGLNLGRVIHWINQWGQFGLNGEVDRSETDGSLAEYVSISWMQRILHPCLVKAFFNLLRAVFFALVAETLSVIADTVQYVPYGQG